MKTLPKYINKEELIYYIRATISKSIVETRLMNRSIPAYIYRDAYYPILKIDVLDSKMTPYTEDMKLFMDTYIKT
jgi:hypothetical protein